MLPSDTVLCSDRVHALREGGRGPIIAVVSGGGILSLDYGGLIVFRNGGTELPRQLNR